MFWRRIRRAYNNNIAFNIGSLTYSTLDNFLNDAAMLLRFNWARGTTRFCSLLMMCSHRIASK